MRDPPYAALSHGRHAGVRVPQLTEQPAACRVVQLLSQHDPRDVDQQSDVTAGITVSGVHEAGVVCGRRLPAICGVSRQCWEFYGGT